MKYMLLYMLKVGPSYLFGLQWKP